MKHGIDNLHGLKSHRITEKQAEEDALCLSKKWSKPFYVYYCQAAGTWQYGSEKPNPEWTRNVRQVSASKETEACL